MTRTAASPARRGAARARGAGTVMRDVEAVRPGDAGRRRVGVRRRSAPRRHRHRRPRQGRRRADHRRPVRRGQRAPRRIHGHLGAGPGRRTRLGPQARRRRPPCRSRCGRSSRTDQSPMHAAHPARDRTCLPRASTAARWPSWSASSATSTLAEEAVQDAFTEAVRALAGRRPAAQPGRLDHHHRPQPGHRPAAPRGVARATGTPQAALLHAPDGADRCRGGPGARRPAAPDLHLLPPGAGPPRPGRADAAAARRADHGGDRARVPRARADHGPAAGPGQGQDPRRPHPVPRAARGRPARPAARRARRRLPDLQRGLRGQLRRRAGPRRPVRRGDPARPPARRADARRARGARACSR